MIADVIGIDRHLYASERGTLGLHLLTTGRGDLSRGQPVDLVVHDQVGKVHVAACRVNKVVAPNTVAVSVPAGRNHGQFVIRLLHTGSHRQRAPVKGVHPVRVEVTREIGGTAYTADGDDLMGLDPEFRTGLLESAKNPKITAARTPVRIDFALIVLGLQGNKSACCYILLSRAHIIITSLKP